MKKILMMAIAGLFMVSIATAQQRAGGDRQRDPKAMTAKVAEKLDFTVEQNAQLKALNARYTGDDYDKRKYREEFKAIMTDSQRAKADEMRQKRMKMKKS